MLVFNRLIINNKQLYINVTIKSQPKASVHSSLAYIHTASLLPLVDTDLIRMIVGCHYIRKSTCPVDKFKSQMHGLWLMWRFPLAANTGSVNSLDINCLFTFQCV